MRSILLGITIYGEHHIRLFKDFCLPSLMAEGNLPTLAKERNIIISLHTDRESFSELFSLDLENCKLKVSVDVTDEDKYTQLGRHQNQDLRDAKKIGADYHLLMPDFIYSDNCFSGILRAEKNGHKAIVRLVMSTVAETILPLLDRPRSAIDLATLAFQNIHPGIRNWLVTDKGFPDTHVMVWVGKDTIRMCSPHCSPVYIANEVLNPVDSELPLDCILDKIIIGDIYCPKPGDGIVIIEVSPNNSRKPQYDCIALREFCRIFAWDTKKSLRQWAIFEEETIDPIHSEIVNNNHWDELEIENMKKTVHNAIEKFME